MTDDLVQQSAPELLVCGSEPVDPVVLSEGSSTVGTLMLGRSLSGDYGASGGGCGRRDVRSSNCMPDVALSRRGGRWVVAVNMG